MQNRNRILTPCCRHDKHTVRFASFHFCRSLECINVPGNMLRLLSGLHTQCCQTTPTYDNTAIPCRWLSSPDSSPLLAQLEMKLLDGMRRPHQQ